MDGPSGNNSVLSSGQARALAAIRGNAARCSRAALPQLRARVSALGYTELDLAEVLEHVRERSPLLIHCRFDVGGRADAATPLAARLLADGCYCNGFEAARRAAFSAASALHGAPADRLAARRAWEHDLFSQAQRGSRTWLPEVLDRFVGPPAGLAAADRPRYGELNLFEAPGGTAAAAALYGRSYIELAACPELRQRVTLSVRTYTRRDGAALATPEHCAHLLAGMPDATLCALLQLLARCDSDAARIANPAFAAADTALPPFANALARFYVEAHVHGPVRMARDVAAVVADAREGCASGALAGHSGQSCRDPGGGELVGVGALRAARALADAHGLRFELLSAPPWLERSVLGRGAGAGDARRAPASLADWQPARTSAGASEQPGSTCGSRMRGSAVHGQSSERGLAWSAWVPWGLLSQGMGAWDPAGLSASPGALGHALGLGPAGRAAAVAGVAACCACAWGLAAAGLVLGALCRTAW